LIRTGDLRGSKFTREDKSGIFEKKTEKREKRKITPTLASPGKPTGKGD
jgi:hypothetical protein